MNELRWVWWNLCHGPEDKDALIYELRRELAATKERELELRRGEWVMRYFDMEADRAKWKEVARLMFAHYHAGDGVELVAEYEAAVRGE